MPWQFLTGRTVLVRVTKGAPYLLLERFVFFFPHGFLFVATLNSDGFFNLKIDAISTRPISRARSFSSSIINSSVCRLVTESGVRHLSRIFVGLFVFLFIKCPRNPFPAFGVFLAQRDRLGVGFFHPRRPDVHPAELAAIRGDELPNAKLHHFRGGGFEFRRGHGL